MPKDESFFPEETRKPVTQPRQVGLVVRGELSKEERGVEIPG